MKVHVLLVLLVLLSGCTTNIESSPTFKECFSKERLAELESMEGMDSFPFETIVKVSAKNLCFKEYALSEKDAKGCDFIQTEKLEDFYNSLTDNQKNTEIGFLLLNGITAGDGCFNNLAVDLKNSSLCENIQDERIRSNCQKHSDPNHESLLP